LGGSTAASLSLLPQTGGSAVPPKQDGRPVLRAQGLRSRGDQPESACGRRACCFAAPVTRCRGWQRQGPRPLDVLISGRALNARDIAIRLVGWGVRALGRPFARRGQRGPARYVAEMRGALHVVRTPPSGLVRRTSSCISIAGAGLGAQPQKPVRGPGISRQSWAGNKEKNRRPPRWSRGPRPSVMAGRVFKPPGRPPSPSAVRRALAGPVGAAAAARTFTSQS